MASHHVSERSSATSASGPRVLFIDDETQLLELYEAFCGSECTAVTAAGVDEAFEAFGPDIDLVFVDRRMPELSGEELVGKLRDRGYQTPVVFVSAVDPDVEPDVEYEAYLKKPIGREQIRTTIAETLS